LNSHGARLTICLMAANGHLACGSALNDQHDASPDYS